MKWVKKILISVLVLFLAAILLDLGLDYWVSVRLPKLINDQNNSPYSITYKNLDISLLKNTILAENIMLCPKAALNDTVIKKGIYAKIGVVDIKGVKIWDLVFRSKIKAENITITKPEVILYKQNENAINNPKSIRSDVVAPFGKIIVVPDIYLNRGDIKIINIKNDKIILNVANISVKLKNVAITDKLLEHKIPFAYQNYTFRCDSLYYRPNAFYHIKSGQIETSDTGLLLEKFTMTPQYNRADFVKRMPKERDIYTLNASTIRFEKMRWGFDKEEQFFFHAGAILINRANANIYRPKMPPDDLRKKPLYNKLLREMPFDLAIDTLKIQNSVLEYEEEKTSERGPGLISFNHFNLNARHLNSGFQKKKLPDVAIAIRCRFMNISPMKVNWSLNVLDKTDGFRIKGNIRKLPADRLAPFIKPYINVTAKGMLDIVYFDFTGNDKTSGGHFGIDYDDLKFTVYREKKPEKKNKLLTAIARIFVKKDTDEKIKDTEVAVERIPEKSFYNLFWRSIEEGLKKILI
ncbi:hypothetical protein [Flavobacterium humi]|uniref:DUF748 domain-containing protein n=1 Tax=Flavobacterium humi TaxID=2562683 RepID=A0A4Z0L4E4_9FLAO|nr:hypothetical protein [Flavobacterium humi]TGD57327.1 hypothetical protein E4635_11955 [Flavobacterium humi]